MIYTIYKISIAGEDYIGSTRDLKQRKATHKSDCYNQNRIAYTIKLYQHIRDNGGWDCCDITPVEEFECETKQQALIREEYWRREYKAMLNMQQAYITEGEKKHNQKIKNETRCSIKNNCECGGKYSIHNKSLHLKTKLHQDFILSNSS
jgi:hypothetical protein